MRRKTLPSALTVWRNLPSSPEPSGDAHGGDLPLRDYRNPSSPKQGEGFLYPRSIESIAQAPSIIVTS